ncbi:MAG: hypothetical protein NC320_10010 [Clostridium sp.]|nr:hypothetical protein [Clostridium sp.]MCM1547690.1 hypothetical protein [Ruminococcus sp.]
MNNDFDAFNSVYPEVLKLINDKKLVKAEEILNENEYEFSALWNHAYALLRMEQGWMNEAYDFFKRAYKLDPSNSIIKDDYKKIRGMKYNGFFKNPHSLEGFMIGGGLVLTCLCGSGLCVGISCEMLKSICCCEPLKFM